MTYDDPELMDALAAEYVLGTLRGPARRRFERLLPESALAREAVNHWEGLLGGIGASLEPVTPPDRIWSRIEARIDPRGRGAGARKGWWGSLGFWRGASAFLAIIAFAAALLAAFPQPQDGLPLGRVAVFEDADDRPMWVISADPGTGALRARAVNAEAAAVDRAYELWMLPADGPPRSLGLLPVNGAVVRHEIPPALLALLADAQGLAVSLEPAGGSPTGAPTGPVLFQTGVLTL